MPTNSSTEHDVTQRTVTTLPAKKRAAKKRAARKRRRSRFRSPPINNSNNNSVAQTRITNDIPVLVSLPEDYTFDEADPLLHLFRLCSNPHHPPDPTHDRETLRYLSTLVTVTEDNASAYAIIQSARIEFQHASRNLRRAYRLHSRVVQGYQFPFNNLLSDDETDSTSETNTTNSDTMA